MRMRLKALEIRNSIVLNLAFPNNTILSSFFFFFLIIDLNFLIPAVTAQIFIPITELVTWTQTNEENAEDEAQSVTVEANITKCST